MEFIFAVVTVWVVCMAVLLLGQSVTSVMQSREVKVEQFRNAIKMMTWGLRLGGVTGKFGRTRPTMVIVKNNDLLLMGGACAVAAMGVIVVESRIVKGSTSQFMLTHEAAHIRNRDAGVVSVAEMLVWELRADMSAIKAGWAREGVKAITTAVYDQFVVLAFPLKQKQYVAAAIAVTGLVLGAIALHLPRLVVLAMASVLPIEKKLVDLSGYRIVDLTEQ